MIRSNPESPFLQPFKKFIAIGSVAVLQDGPCKGKIAAIVDVIDQNRVLLDGPCSDVPRQEYPIKNLHLTTLKVRQQFENIIDICIFCCSDVLQVYNLSDSFCIATLSVPHELGRGSLVARFAFDERTD